MFIILKSYENKIEVINMYDTLDIRKKICNLVDQALCIDDEKILKNIFYQLGELIFSYAFFIGHTGIMYDEIGNRLNKKYYELADKDQNCILENKAQKDMIERFSKASKQAGMWNNIKESMNKQNLPLFNEIKKQEFLAYKNKVKSDKKAKDPHSQKNLSLFNVMRRPGKDKLECKDEIEMQEIVFKLN
jgi:hypothetical protein